MKVLIAISDQVWGGKQRFMTDVLIGMRDAGFEVDAIVEEGGQLAGKLSHHGFEPVLVPSFAHHSAQAAQIVAARLVADVHVVCATGRGDAAALNISLRGCSHRPMTMFIRHSAFPLDEGGEARAFVDAADLLVATSHEQVASQFDRERASGRNVVVVPSFVDKHFVDSVADADTMSARADLDIPEDSFVFAVLSRLSWEKGIARAVSAMAEVGDSADEVTMLIAGDGPQRTELTELAGNLGLSDRVRFLGHADDTRGVLAAADAVVLPTTVPETGPLALKEAMGAGKPVIATRIGGIPEFVRHQTDGLLVSSDDELVVAMNSLWTDTSQAMDMGRNARESIIRGHLREHRMPYLLQCIERQAVRTVDPAAFLTEFSWEDVRIRPEASGGLLFVPRTSAVLELSEPLYRVLHDSAEGRRPEALSCLPRPAFDKTVGQLLDMGALTRRAA
jgi:glycosyltransferase involved in cell wall biosynthesis